MSDTQNTSVLERDGLGRGAALVGAGLAAAGLLAARSASAQTTAYIPGTLYFTTSPGTGAVQVPGTGNIKVLNYALALETLEAELYRQALARLTTGGQDMFGQTITGLNLTTTDSAVQYVAEFGKVEAQHRDFLTGALGGNWVADAKARFDFGFADTNNFGIPAATAKQVVEIVYVAELTGVSAYLGAIPSFTDKTYLANAASILGTEARHTTYVSALLNGDFNETPKIETAPLANENSGRDYPVVPDGILNAGGQVGPGTTLAGDGKLSPISGSNGYQGKGFVFVPAPAAV